MLARTPAVAGQPPVLDRRNAKSQTRLTMRRVKSMRHASVAATAIVVGLCLAACGSSSTPSSASSSAAPSGKGGSGQGANLAAAKQAITPFTGHPSPFPVKTPLRKALPVGTKFVYLQCSAPACAQIGQGLAAAVKVIGGSFRPIAAGATASTAQAAAASALSLKPAAVLVPALPPSLFGDGLKKLQAAGVKVVAVGMINPKPYGVTYGLDGLQPERRAGKLLADWVIVNKGAKANAVFYTVPELSFSPYIFGGFEQEMKKNCPACAIRAVPISATTFGTTAPQTIANDLQAHPSTNVAVSASEEMTQGLPSALSSAGVSVTTNGLGPTPENLQDIKAGRLTAGLGVDVPVLSFSAVDAAARLVLGEKPVPGEDAPPVEFLDQGSITFNPQNGWMGYPKVAQMFAKLWHVAP